ncbi:hypothetical protein [Flavobacterium flavipallidum]|uniref:Uncharacterized protein n=1 Tax=Flavobacterium flavipallidum TaxID=3139140 RepID=A0ABU9HQ35_9FLAO
MGYYTRVFCSSTQKPKINQILDYLNTKGHNISINLNELPDNWNEFELFYDSERLPLIVELNEKESDHLAEQEIEEFCKAIGKPSFFELNKKKVFSHLNKTEYIICIQLPTSDILDKGYDVNGDFMNYLETNFYGMIQCDNEGFYLKTKPLCTESAEVGFYEGLKVPLFLSFENEI